MSKRALTDKQIQDELEKLLENNEDMDCDFTDEESSIDESDNDADYEEKTDSDQSNTNSVNSHSRESNINNDGSTSQADDESSDGDETEDDKLSDEEPETSREDVYSNIVIWSDVTPGFQPRKSLSSRQTCRVSDRVSRFSSVIDIFLRMFPFSLFIQIASCTNERLRIEATRKKRKIEPTDPHEIMCLIGCTFIMCYNRLPALNCYWSSHPSMGNSLIKSAFSRDRCKMLLSKLYVNCPEKPVNAGKLHYVEPLLSCLKSTFQQNRQDSAVQSIDESMTKFKGRSTLKQYLPMKPVKRGIKIWMRCDAQTGYTYDMNIYAGREAQASEGTLGERVVQKLASTITEKDVTLVFDRFFTSVRLMDTLPFAAVGTCMVNRKNVPKMPENLQPGESLFKVNESGTLATRWKDTKDLILLSNCHDNALGEVRKKLKDGTRKDVSCPEAIVFYRKMMGGVDLADQMAGLYDLDRKSLKWWKKVFYRLLMVSAVNSWVLYKEVHRRPRMSFLEFLIDIAEALIARGQSKSRVQRRRSTGCGKRSKKARNMENVGTHLPYEGPTRRRCAGCSRMGKETRTKTICKSCSIPYCKKCFLICHA